MSNIIRSVRHVARGYSPAQILVSNATVDDEPDWPTQDQLESIAKLTRGSATEFYDVVDTLEKRLTEKKKKWRHVLKGLAVCDYLVHRGSALVVTWARQKMQIFLLLQDFQFVDSSGLDVGHMIRSSALELTMLLSDEDRIQAGRNPGWEHPQYDLAPSRGNVDVEIKPVQRPLSQVDQIENSQTHQYHESTDDSLPDGLSETLQGSPGEGALLVPVNEEKQGSQTSLEVSNTWGNTAIKSRSTPFADDPASNKSHDGFSEAAKKLLGEGARSAQVNALARYEAPHSPHESVSTLPPDILSEAAKKLLGEGARSAQEAQAVDDHRRKDNSPIAKGAINQTLVPDRKQQSAGAPIARQAIHPSDGHCRSSPSDSAKKPRASPLRPKLPSKPVSSGKVHRQVSDLVRDSKLETNFPDDTVTQHIHYVSDMKTQRRRVRKEARWTVVRKLAAGSFGQVWLQQCTEGDDVGKLRAVKEISRGREEQQPDIDYQRELEAIAKFSHEKYVHCFVKSFGWYEKDHAVFIAMEYFEKGDLQSYLVKPFPEAEVREVSFQVLEGLSYMHDNRFAHRDLKPGNILVSSPSPNWWVKISDFGISKRAEEEQTAFRTMVGTKGYLAPEVIGIFSPREVNVNEENDESYTVVVDIWALGAIAFRMLTNRNAFPEPRRLWNYVVLNQSFPEELLVEVGATQDCRDLLAKLMAAAPSMRPSANMALSHPWMIASDLPAQTSSSDISGKQAETLQDSAYDSTATASWTAVLAQTSNSNQDPTIS